MGFLDDIKREASAAVSNVSGAISAPLQEFSQQAFGTSFEDVLLQRYTFGLVGLDDEGGVKPGAVTRGVDEAVGEVTSRNVAREALNRQTQQIRAEEARREQLLADEQKRAEETDIQASRAAGRLRGDKGARGAGGQTFSLGEQRDFLGL